MLIDANIFLEVLLEQNNADKCKLFLREILTGNKKAFISTISIDSIVLSMVRNKVGNEGIKTFLRGLFQYRGLKFYQIKIKDRISSLDSMKKYNLDYEDGLILQAAVSTHSKEIASLDKHFDKIKEIKRIEP